MFFIAYAFKGQVLVFAGLCNIEIFLSPAAIFLMERIFCNGHNVNNYCEIIFNLD